MEVDFKAGLVYVTPVLYASAVSADKMHLSDVFAIDGIIAESGGTATLLSVGVVDLAILDTAFDILFFRASPTLTSAKGATLSITDAEMAAKFLNRVSVSTYVDLAANSTATLNASSCGIKLEAAEGSKTIYGIIQSRGVSGSAYGASGLTLNFGTDQD